MRPIDADAMKDTNDNVIVVIDPETKSKYLISLNDYINAQPTVDTIKHAHWEIIDQDSEGDECFAHVWETLRCSNCGMERETEDGYKPEYCEGCGAKMDGEAT